MDMFSYHGETSILAMNIITIRMKRIFKCLMDKHKNILEVQQIQVIMFPTINIFQIKRWI